MYRSYLRLLGFVIVGSALAGCGDDDEPEEKWGDAGADGGGVLVVLEANDELPDPPDGEQECASGACNYQAQTGCAANRTCAPQLASGNLVPACLAAGAKPEGSACSGWTDCGAGLFCAEGTCRKFCCGGDWSACPEGQSCFRTLFVRDPATDAAVSADAYVCAPVDNCNVLDPNACSDRPGTACQVIDPLGHVACASEGRAQVGDDCSRNEPCARGLLCRGGECVRLCRAVRGAGEPCEPGREACVHFNRDPAGVGECTEL
ncbi:MAG TPA: hypothetical protein VI072_18505 [Polyangiaceae bacterium]